MSVLRFICILIASGSCLPAFAQNGWQADPQLVARLSQQRQGINYLEANVPDYTLPDPLKSKGGTAVHTAEQWPDRRAEILELFRSEVYGRRPGKPQELKCDVVEENSRAVDGQATLKRIAIRSRHEGRSHEFELILFLPNAAKGPVPVFLLINNRQFTNTDPTRQEKSEFWPVEEVIARGYGIAAIQNADLAPDDKNTYREGIIRLFEGDAKERPADACEALAAWGFAVLRAIATDDNAHSSSRYWMLTGTPHTPKNQENALPGALNDRPSTAAVVRHLKGDRSSLPGAVRLPEEIWNTGRIVWPGQDAGWLGASADPWLLTCDPNAPDFRPPDIALPVDVSAERFARRRSLQDLMNQQFRAVDHARVQRWSKWQEKAIDLLRTDEAQAAFAIDSEPDSARDRYGRNRFGQSVLLARRLIEAGVSLVQVNWTRGIDDPDIAPAWDTHANNSERLKTSLMPPMDQAYSALLEDLSDRGLLDETLVVWMGEFGRSPKINPSAGRDHWGHVFTVALAGGGVRGGVVHGASDRHGGFPLHGRVEPQDLTATIYHCLGLSPESTIHDKFGRPLAISNGHPIEALF